MDSQKPVPRMRTAPRIVAEIRAMDPKSEVTEYCVRKMIKDGSVPVFWAGQKALVNLDDVLRVLRAGTGRAGTADPPESGIRRVDVSHPMAGGSR